MTYKSEIWGVYAKPDFKTWDSSQIEKTQFQFCKRFLEVNNKASYVACRAKRGRLPLNITIKQKPSTTFSIFSLKMKNLSLSNLF